MSWSKKSQKYIDLFIEPRRGLTKHLAKLSEHGDTTINVAFSGPHGRVIPLAGYEHVLMITTGFGIAAQFPLLEKIIQRHYTQEAPMRRIRLVWQIRNKDIGMAVQDLLNTVLDQDVHKLLQISFYIESGNYPPQDPGLPWSPRIPVYAGTAPLAKILAEEIEEHKAAQTRGKILVTVSAASHVRNDLVELIRGQTDGLDLAPLEYQP